MEVAIAKTENELNQIAEILVELRTAYTTERLVNQIKRQQEKGYQIAYIDSGGSVMCVAGFIISEKLAWGKHIYVDDLVTATKNRSSNYGKKMIQWLINYAIDNDCGQIHLDSGVQRFSAHRFYLREGFSITSHHFSLRNLG